MDTDLSLNAGDARPADVPAVAAESDLRDWPRLKLLHPLQAAHVQHTYIPYSSKITGWALDPTGSCRVELWHGPVLLAAMTADREMAHPTAAAEGRVYRPDCGFSFIPSHIPPEADSLAIDFMLKAIAPDGRSRALVLSYAATGMDQYASIQAAARDDEKTSIQKLLCGAFSSRTARLHYVFHGSMAPIGDPQRLADCRLAAARLAEFFPIAERQAWLLADEAANPLKRLASLADLPVDPPDFVFLVDADAGASVAYDREVSALLTAIVQIGRLVRAPDGAAPGTALPASHEPGFVCLTGVAYRAFARGAALPRSVQPLPSAPPCGILGQGFAFAHVNGPVCEAERIRSILVIKLDRIGDIVSTVPAITRLRALFGSARLTFLVNSYSAPFVAALGLADEILVSGSDLGGRHWDLAIDLRIDADTRSVLHAAPAHLKSSLAVVGEQTAVYPANYLVAPGILPSPGQLGRLQSQHVNEQLYGLVDRIERNLSAFFPADAQASNLAGVARLRMQHRDQRPRGDTCLLAPLHPSDGRSWDNARFAEIARRVWRTYGWTICLVGSGDEVPICRSIADGLLREGVPADGLYDAPADELVGRIASARFFIGLDSGIKHLAGLLGVPGVAVHAGRHTPKVWGTPAPFMMDVYSLTTCSPCLINKRADCHNGSLCEENISVDHVWRAIEIVHASQAWRELSGPAPKTAIAEQRLAATPTVQSEGMPDMSVVSFVLANTRHGALIVNRFDYMKNASDHLIGVGLQLLQNGIYEPAEADLLRSLLADLRASRGDRLLALDIGANIGVLTIEMARTMQGWGEVRAFEPQERTFYALCGNLALGNFFNAHATQAALSDQCGMMTIPWLDPTKPASFGSLEIEQLARTEDIGQPIDYADGDEVRVLTVDSLNLDRVGLMKIDVEGMELKTIAGSRRTLQQHRPAILVEYIKTDRQRLEAELGEFGYWTTPVHSNLLAIHSSDPMVESYRGRYGGA